MSSNQTFLKVCEWCGETFTAKKSSTAYCSHKCNGQAYKAKKRKQSVLNVESETMNKKVALELGDVVDKEFLTPTMTATLLGIGRATVYRYLHDNELKSYQLKGKTLIRRSDIEAMFDNAAQYRARPKRDSKPITEFYTIAEIKEKFGVKEAWIFKIVKEKRIPKVLRKGKSYISKSHIDNHFAKHAPDQSIEQWYTPTEIQEKFSMSLNAIYSFVYENAIPKKKEGRNVFYSKKHFDIAKGAEKPLEPQYYSVEEAMQKFGVTRDALYNQIKTNKIPKIREGRYIKISKPELDNLYEEPIIL